MLFLEFVDFFEFAEGFGFFGFGGAGGVEKGFELLLFAVEGAHGLAIIKGEAAFLEAGVAFEDNGFPGGWVCEYGVAELLAVDLRDLGHQIDGVDGQFRRVVQ